MQLSFGKGLMAGAAGAALVLAITAAANGLGVGTPFLLGKTNTVNAISTLTGNTKGPMLKVINSGSSSPSLSGHLATVQTDQVVNGNDTNKCDFAAVAYAAP